MKFSEQINFNTIEYEKFDKSMNLFFAPKIDQTRKQRKFSISYKLSFIRDNILNDPDWYSVSLLILMIEYWSKNKRIRVIIDVDSDHCYRFISDEFCWYRVIFLLENILPQLEMII